jgi:WhiB family redox-sensing transcriptional regulator
MMFEVPPRPDWWDRAACRAQGPKSFFAEGQGSEPQRRVAEARKVCQGCSVRIECLEANIDEKFGVWGGTSVEERLEIKRHRRSAA